MRRTETSKWDVRHAAEIRERNRLYERERDFGKRAVLAGRIAAQCERNAKVQASRAEEEVLKAQEERFSAEAEKEAEKEASHQKEEETCRKKAVIREAYRSEKADIEEERSLMERGYLQNKVDLAVRDLDAYQNYRNYRSDLKAWNEEDYDEDDYDFDEDDYK
jgi:hypothetical protein